MRFLGTWAPAMWLTLAGGSCGALGIAAAVTGRPSLACALLVLAGLADLFDGPVARRLHRDLRSEQIGGQLDSLADTISFLALPVALTAALAPGWPVAAALAYVPAGLMRLAVFNLEHVPGRRTHYRGVPVTYAALVIPVVALIAPAALPLALLALAVGFVLDVPVRKPRGAAYLMLGAVAIVVLTLLALRGVR